MLDAEGVFGEPGSVQRGEAGIVDLRDGRRQNVSLALLGHDAEVELLAIQPGLRDQAFIGLQNARVSKKRGLVGLEGEDVGGLSLYRRHGGRQHQGGACEGEQAGGMHHDYLLRFIDPDAVFDI